MLYNFFNIKTETAANLSIRQKQKKKHSTKNVEHNFLSVIATES